MTGCPPEVDTAWPADAAEALAGLLSAARPGGTPGATAALASLAATRRLAAELERGELALIEAARSGGATWSQISAALGTRNRQIAQKRHADLARRRPRPPAVDAPESRPAAQRLAASGDGRPQAGPTAAREGGPPGTTGRLRAAVGTREHATALAPEQKAATARRPTLTVPKITDAVIAEGRYELVRAPDYAETRAWQVLVDGRLAGLVRPTWRGERSRPGWEPVTAGGTVLPVKGTGRVTPAGNARTRDAAAISLLAALQRQQRARKSRAGTAERRHGMTAPGPARARKARGQGAKALLIPVDGPPRAVDLPSGGGTRFMRWLRELIGTDCAERIWITSRWEAWLDENGASAGKPANQAATLLAILRLAVQHLRDGRHRRAGQGHGTGGPVPGPGRCHHQEDQGTSRAAKPLAVTGLGPAGSQPR